MLYSQVKRLFSNSILVMSGLCFFMTISEKVEAQQQFVLPPLLNPKPAPLPIVPPPQGAGNTPAQPGNGNGNTPPAAANGNVPPRAGQPQVNPGFPFPWLPNGGGSNNGVPPIGAAGITIDYTCPLLDRDGTNDMMASLDALARALPMKNACNNNDTNFNELYQKQKDMFKSAEEIKNFITNSNTLWVAGKSNEEYSSQINGLNSQISSLMTNISYISESLDQNGLLDTNCNHKMISKGKALNALSDLILQISPYAFYAANAAVSIGADMALMGPVLSGVSGLASLVNTVSKLNKSEAIDMSQADNRLLVMKATCEYMRIEGKLRYLRLPEIGTQSSKNEGINKLNLLIKSKNKVLKQLEKSLLSREGDSVLVNIFEERSYFYNETKIIREKLRSDWTEYLRYDEFRNSDNSESNLCSIGSFIVEDKKDNKFPYTIAATIEALEKLSNFDRSALAYRMAKKNFENSLIKLEEKVNSKLINNVIAGPNGPAAITCGAVAQDALNKMAKVLQVIESQVVASEKSYEEKLQKNNDYKEWYQKNEALIKERDNLKGIVTVITKTSEQITPTNLSELNIKLESLRHTLFGTKESYPVLTYPLKRLVLNNFGVQINSKNPSPLGSWFENTAIEHAKFIDYFNKSIKAILAETKEELKNNDVYTGAPPNGDYFQYFNLKVFPEGSRAHPVICNKLREAASNWKIANDHLNKMKNVCKALKDYIDTKTGYAVVDFCGMETINRNGNTDTFISNVETDLKNSGLINRARQVNEKYAELKCF